MSVVRQRVRSLVGSRLGLIGRPYAMTGDGDCFESAVYAEGTKHVTDVVVDRLRAEVELLCDLFGRASVFEQTKHLDLTGGEMRVRRCGFLCGAFLDQPEDADHPFHRSRAAPQLSSTATRVPSVETRTPVASVAGAVPSILLREQLAARRAVLGRDDGGEVATANIPEKLLGGQARAHGAILSIWPRFIPRFRTRHGTRRGYFGSDC